jgi:hypothetical protein
MNSERPHAAQDQKEREQVGGEPVQPGPEVPEGAELGAEEPNRELVAGGDEEENLTPDDGTEAGETM